MIQRISPIRKDMIRAFFFTIFASVALAIFQAPNAPAQDPPVLTRREFCRRVWAEIFPPYPAPPRLISSAPAPATPASGGSSTLSPSRAYRWFVSYQKQYWREVGETRGLRLFLRPREREGWWVIRSVKRDGSSVPNSFPGGEGPDFWRTTGNFFANPIATFLDRPRQATWPVVSLGWYLFFDRPLARMEQEAAQLEAETAQSHAMSRSVPGAEYTWRFMTLNMLSQENASLLINEHASQLQRWLDGKENNLPRVQEMVRVGLLSAAEESQFYALMRDVFPETQAVVQRITNLVRPPNSATATRLLWELSHLPPDARRAKVRELLTESLRSSSEAERVLDQTLNDIELVLRLDQGRPSLNPQLVAQMVLSRLINRPGSNFANLSPQTRNLLATAFFPLVRTRSGNSDLELHRRLSLDSQAPASVQTIRELLNAQKITLHEALLMTENAATLGAQTDARLERLRTFMPPNIVPALNRPEIPHFSRKRTFDGQTIEGEEGRWRLIYTDPRFRPLREALEKVVQERAANSTQVQQVIVEVLSEAEAMIQGWQEFLDLDRAAGSRPLPESIVFRLFGITPQVGLNSRPNSLIQPMIPSLNQRMENYLQREEQNQTQSNKALNPEAASLEHTKRCFSGVAEAWRNLVREHSRWLRENPNGDYEAFRRGSFAEQNQRLDQALTSCGPEN